MHSTLKVGGWVHTSATPRRYLQTTGVLTLTSTTTTNFPNFIKSIVGHSVHIPQIL